jgi:DNA modification methylase
VVAAMQAGKLGIGLDICAAYIERARIRADGLRTLWHDEAPLPDPILRVADARNLLAYVEPSSVDLCITSPPYWDILTQKRSADYKPVRNYGDLADDLGRIQNYRAFLDELIAVFHQVFVALRPNCHCVVVVMDIRKKNQFYPFHADVADFMMKIGFIYDDLIIWNRKAEYNNLRPLGYPSVFRVNKIHEFILLFKTPASREKCKIDWKILEQASAHASKGGIAAQRP